MPLSLMMCAGFTNTAAAGSCYSTHTNGTIIYVEYTSSGSWTGYYWDSSTNKEVVIGGGHWNPKLHCNREKW